MMVADRKHGQISGAAYSTNDGSTWTLIDNLGHNSIAFINPTTGWTSCVTTSYHTTEYIQKWAGPMLSIDMSEQPITPTYFTLRQNYPNPFNPTTSIEFGLPQEGLVRLSVYDIFGRLVATPTEGNSEAGMHSIQFDGADLPSGIYMYQLEWNGGVKVKKMTLLK